MKIVIIQLITAFIGSLGFAFLFNVRKKIILQAALGGLLGWCVYLIAEELIGGIFVPYLIASAFLELYAEILARILKVPTTVIFIPAVIPLIPGGSLFQTMSYAVRGNFEMFKAHGYMTVQYTLAIAAGMSIIWSIGYILRRVKIEKTVIRR